MNHSDMLVIGGTSDARVTCQQLDTAGVCYTSPVATPTGERPAGNIRGRIRCRRTEWQQMAERFRAQRTRWMTDASHLYAEMASQNIVCACASAGVLLSRYQRPEQLSDLRHPLFHVVGDLNEACALARHPGERILLITGSKDLAAWWAGLAEKTLLARVLLVLEVVQHCNDLGFGVGEILALCGPSSAEFSVAFCRQCRADVMATKTSGAEGGYQERVQPYLNTGVSCIIITHPVPLVRGDELSESQADLATWLICWLSAT